MTLQIEHLQHDGYEQVVSFRDDEFCCFIAIHNTRLGPAIGGCRIKPYPSDADALFDVLRLAKGMTYKSSLAGLNFGGGKCVVMADRASPEIMRKVGEAVNYFQGNYITAEDIGTTLADTMIAGEVTPFVAHLDGSSMTARGVLASMQAAAKYLGKGEDIDFSGVPIWVQGLGKVGMDLVQRLQGHNNVYVNDLRADLVTHAKTLGAYEITEIDRRFIAIYAPCAMGQVVNAGNVNGLTYTIICGSANNVLADDSYAEILHQRHVLYCPDYLVNSGGVINAAYEMNPPFDQAACDAATDALGERLVHVLSLAEMEKITPLAAANLLAEARL